MILKIILEPSEEGGYTDTVGYNFGSLMEFIDLGEISLPDIQRQFVWGNA